MATTTQLEAEAKASNQLIRCCENKREQRSDDKSPQPLSGPLASKCLQAGCRLAAFVNVAKASGQSIQD